MYHVSSRKVQADFRRMFKLLTFEILTLPVAIFLMCGFSIGLVEVLSGASGADLTLQFVDSTVGPLAHMQAQLLTLVGFVFLLSFFPCRDWVGTSTSYLTVAKLRESARLWSLAAPTAPILMGATSESSRWLAYWNRTEIRQAPYLAGDHPQLE